MFVLYDLSIGAFFGTTFAPLLFQTYREIAPAPFCPPHSSHHYLEGEDPRSNASSPDNLSVSGADGFVNPNPHGGKKRPSGKVYEAKLFGFRVNEKARSGPRMKWLRMRPETLEELDHVDWRGQWKNPNGDEEDDFDADGEDDDDEGGGGHRRLENFDDDLPGEEGEEEEEEEEEDGGAGGRGGPSIPYPPAAPSGRLGGRGRAALAPIPDWTPAQEEEDDKSADESDCSSASSSSSSLITPDDRPSVPKRLFTEGNSKQALAPLDTPVHLMETPVIV